jgi:Mrp family chromosome partitioning ATPase/capsular polysaccharide biosynthesis protein
MDILDYLRALRRRWRVILLVTLVAAAAAFITTPSQAERREVPVGTVYQATTTLLRAPEAQEAVDLATIRLYVTTGDIPKRAAEKLQYDGPPAGLAAQVTVGGDDQVGTVTIGTTNPDADFAERVANTFAEETMAFLVRSAERNTRAGLDSVDSQIDDVLKSMADVNDRLSTVLTGSIQESALVAEKSALEGSLVNLYSRRTQLQTSSAAISPLNVLEEAEAYPQLTSAPSLQAPQSSTPRLLLGLIAGLVLGGAAALLIERLDTRLQGREQAESAFGLPVVAEIPHFGRAMRRLGSIVAVSAPESAAAEAYRSLRAALLLMPSRNLRENSPRTEPVNSGSVVLVTAPTNRSGKSTTAANLAACLAESGRRVLVLDGDLRNPAVAEMLGVAAGPGLADVALMGDAGRLDKLVHSSSVASVGVVTAGLQVSAGGVVGASLGPILNSARELADVVIVDAAPMLAGSDALDLMPYVDTVVMVGRLRRTTRDNAQRARDLLGRIGVPVLGVALVGTRGGTVAPSGSASLRDRFSGLRRSSSQRGRESERRGAHAKDRR